MQVNLETLSPSERRLRIAIPFEQIDGEIQNRLKRIAKTTRVHGFRPGKVPLKVVEQYYGSQVRQEVMSDTVQRTFGEAVREQNLKIIGDPQFEPIEAANDQAEPAQQFEFSAVFEVYPEVKVGDISHATIEVIKTEITEADIDKTIDILRKQRVVYHTAGRAAQSGDRAIIDYQGTLDGQAFDGGTAKDFPLILGQGQFLPDFESQVIGMEAGESKSFELTFPTDYPGQDIAGKVVNFTVTLNQLAEPVLPELNEDFAKMLGVDDGNLSTMRDEIKLNIEREVGRRVNKRTKENVMQALLEHTEVSLPKSLVEMESQRIQEQAKSNMAARGIQVEDLALPTEAFEKEAERRISLGLIIAELVKTHQLEAKPEQIRKIVEELAESYEQPEELIKWYYAKADRLETPGSLAIEENVVTWALSQAKSVEKRLGFDELMENA